MPEQSQAARGLEVAASSDRTEDTIFPLDRMRMTSEEVLKVYAALLGRRPETDSLWTDKPALDAILRIATSPEARAYKAAPPTELQFTDGKLGRFATYRSDRVIGASIRARGHFEEQAVSEALAILEKLGVAPRLTTFLDVGANIGTHDIAAIRFGFQRAVCVEADRDNFKLLKVNHLLNDVDGICIDVHAALSDFDGTGTMQRSPTNFGDHRVKAAEATGAAAKYGEDGWEERSVPVRRLDSLLAELRIAPDEIGLAWVDTQGHEGHVLAGGSSLLAAATPLVLEFWPYGLDRSGGYPMLKAALGRRSRYFDLRESLKAGAPVALSMADIDQLYTRYLSESTPSNTPHTDLIVL